ncbi:MAG: hypothetical protein J7K84_08350 [Deltaproteobacteria bacterium]|nr:hypothetical protein [Deltaproteobacteria bacterium]
MGKKNLTKSTTKKKTKTKKTAAKKTTATKKGAKTTKKKITLKDLIFKKFDTWKPEESFKVEIDKEALKAYTAPPFITGSPDDTDRIKNILFKKFDPETMRKQIEELKAMAEQEAVEKAAIEKAEAERKAAEEKAALEKAAAEKKLAEEKAAKEKVEAEKKAAIEKAAREKAEAEKKEAEEKAAKEKAEAEKRAAEEKEAKEKAEAERKAAEEKAALEKAAAEKKLAEEKAAKEKVEAEKKAAIEKAAREKAEAEKKVAKKAAAEKKAAEMKKNIIIASAGFALILLMLIGTSFLNMSNFYLKPVEGGIEIWRGSFAPMGQKEYFALQGAELQEPAKKVYSKKDVYPLIFNDYIKQADSLLETKAIPDFDEIKHNLDNALKYGVTAELCETAQSRLNRIDFMILVYKADIAAAKNSLESLKSAMSYYKEAAELNPAEHQAKQLKLKIESMSQKMFLLEQDAAIEAEKDASTFEDEMPEAAEH